MCSPFLKGLVDADVSGTEPSASTSHKSDRLARDESVETPEIEIVLKGDVMMHEDFTLIQPCLCAVDKTRATVVNANKPSAGTRMRGHHDAFCRIESANGRAIHHNKNLIRLSYRFLSPIRRGVIRKINDQVE